LLIIDPEFSQDALAAGFRCFRCVQKVDAPAQIKEPGRQRVAEFELFEEMSFHGHMVKYGI
jgi:hypothetical protein